MRPKTNLKPQVLIPEVRLQSRVQELAAQIMQDYVGKEVTFVCVLKGSFIFFSDLVREIDLPVTCDFLGVSSYGNSMESSGEVKFTLDLHEGIEGRHVIVVEDIVDTGLTLQFILQTLSARKPASLKTCALLMKPECLKSDIDVDYLGFKIGKEFVVGYGLDYAGKYRGLPYVGELVAEH